ncbi:MAG TPA: DUF6714 family protein [Verrucomicrobiae bacterium]|nr:DUF6714 family protein [Verrucomicrobiae bacterium]
MSFAKHDVAAHIREAFRGVTLGNGVGLLEGQALDDYADQATREAYREQDEKDDWQHIPLGALNRCHSSLSFFDAEGMRFHLPAFLLAELNGDLAVSVVYHLSEVPAYSENQLVALSVEQRKAVRKFLLLVRDMPDYEFERPHIERALLDYWLSE